MRAVALVLLLAACAAPVPPVAPSVPEALRTCPPTPAAVPVPPKPRGFDAVVAWANATDKRRVETVHALEVCRERLIETDAWIEQHLKDAAQ